MLPSIFSPSWFIVPSGERKSRTLPDRSCSSILVGSLKEGTICVSSNAKRDALGSVFVVPHTMVDDILSTKRFFLCRRVKRECVTLLFLTGTQTFLCLRHCSS